MSYCVCVHRDSHPCSAAAGVLCVVQRTATLNWPGLAEEEEQQEGGEHTNHTSNNGSPLQHMSLPGRCCLRSRPVMHPCNEHCLLLHGGDAVSVTVPLMHTSPMGCIRTHHKGSPPVMLHCALRWTMSMGVRLYNQHCTESASARMPQDCQIPLLTHMCHPGLQVQPHTSSPLAAAPAQTGSLINKHPGGPLA
jgi:hypothetical protein